LCAVTLGPGSGRKGKSRGAVWPGVDRLCLSVYCDCSKAERELGFKPVTLRRMVEDSYVWLKGEGLI